MLKQSRRTLQRVEDLIIVVAFAIMVAAFFFQVINRNFIQASMPWLEELAVYSMIYLVLLGTEAGLRDGSQVAVTAVVDRFSGRGKLLLQAIAKLIIVAFSVAMFWASLNIVLKQIDTGQTSAALGLPMWVPFGAFLLAFTIIVVVQGVALVILVKALIKGDESIAEGIGTKVDEVEALMLSEAAVLKDEENQR